MLTQAQFRALAARARLDALPFMASAITISTKQRTGQAPIMKLVLNGPQQKVEAAIRAQREAGMPGRVITLKARQPGVCLSPKTAILTADLRWVPLSAVRPGDRLVAVDETGEARAGAKRSARRLRTAIVEAVRTVREPAYVVELEDARTLIATGPHRFLSRQRGGPCPVWRAVNQTRPGDVIRTVTRPWRPGVFEDGWFAGLLDGEGWGRPKERAGIEVTVCQAAGVVFDRAVRYLQDNGYTFRVDVDDRPSTPTGKLGRKPVYSAVLGRMDEIFRLVGQTRPARWLTADWWEGKELPGKKIGGRSWVAVTAITPLGDQEMIDLQTSTGTFLAEGLVSHNSTYCCGKNLVTKLTQPYAQTITVAHIEDAAEKLFRREKFMVERLPEGIRPKLAIERKNELLFKHIACSDGDVELSSTGSTGYATGKPIWRGMTIHGVHLSEFAFFGLPASDVLLGVMQSVPDSPDSYVIIESTANGMGNPFQEEWARAEDGESGFAPVFIGWWELPDAIAAVPEDFRLESDEKHLVKAYGLSAAQVQWRRNTLYTMCQGNLDLFQQEYPGSAAEAFLVTGRPAFPVPVLRKMHERALKVEPRRGVLDMTQTEPRRQFVARQDGELAIWRWPEPDHLYVIGADAAEGTEDGDFSAAAVVDRTTQQMVAMWHGKRSPIPFAHALMDLGAFYYGAMLAPEISGGHGFSVIDECKARGYYNLYQWQRTDRVKNTTTNFFGWMTTSYSRPLLFDTMHYALTNGDLMIWCPGTIMEMLAVRYVESRPEGEEHDDRVFALMIAWLVHLQTPMGDGQLPRMVRGEAKRPGPPDGPPLRNVERQVWAEIDQELKRGGAGRAPLSALGDLVVTDDELAEGSEETADMEMPPGGWW